MVQCILSFNGIDNGVHHTIVLVQDLDASVHFYSAGIGLEILSRGIDGSDFTQLFDARAQMGNVSAAFLGDKSRRDNHAGVLELAHFECLHRHESQPEIAQIGATSFSFLVDVEQTLSRLASLGIGGEPGTANIDGESWASVHDPNGALVILIPQNTTIRAN